IPKNPRWGWQVNHPGSLPDPSKLCNGFPLSGDRVSLGSPPCTTQAPTVDAPSGWNAIWCNAGGHSGRLNGHLNWMPATYEGLLFWEDHSTPGTDDDYNFRLMPAGQAGLVQANLNHPYPGLELEFDSDETIDHFHTPWWTSFHKAVDAGDQQAQAMVKGKF